MTSPSKWELNKEDQSRIYGFMFLPMIFKKAILIYKWWKTRYPENKMRVVFKKEFEQVRIQK